MATTTDALGHVTTFHQPTIPTGGLTSFTDPNGLVTKLAYNFRGAGDLARMSAARSPTYAYDRAGQLTKTTHAGRVLFRLQL